MKIVILVLSLFLVGCTQVSIDDFQRLKDKCESNDEYSRYLRDNIDSLRNRIFELEMRNVKIIEKPKYKRVTKPIYEIE